MNAMTTTYEYRIDPDAPTVVLVRRKGHRAGGRWRCYMDCGTRRWAEHVLMLLRHGEAVP